MYRRYETPLGPGAERFLAFLTTPLTSSSEGDAKQKGLVGSGTAGMSTLSCRDSWRRASLYVLSKWSSNLSCSTESSPDFGGSSSDLPYLYGLLKKLLIALLLSYFLCLPLSARRKSLTRLFTSSHRTESPSLSSSLATFHRRRSAFFSPLRRPSSRCRLEFFFSCGRLTGTTPNLTGDQYLFSTQM